MKMYGLVIFVLCLVFGYSNQVGLIDKSDLRKDSEIILVGGYRPLANYEKRETYLRELCWKLHSKIYNVSPMQKDNVLPKLKVIVNRSKLLETSPENVRDLRNIVYDMNLEESGIKKVIFAHSQGSEVVFKALKDDSFERFLRTKGLSETDAKRRIKKIRNQIAVFTFGGIQQMPRRFAKVSYNFIFIKDAIAKFGRAFARGHEEEFIVVYLKGKYNYCSTSGSNHSLREYLDSETLINDVVHLLRSGSSIQNVVRVNQEL